MSFGMERNEIVAKVTEELKERRGGLERFDGYEVQLIASAVASVIIESNTKIQYALGEAGVDFG